MSKPVLSIIVPIYKTEKYLKRCVDSILKQSITDFEVILIDDESPDRSPVICDEYAQKDPRVKVIHKKNQGLGMARNSGMQIATGKYRLHKAPSFSCRRCRINSTPRDLIHVYYNIN